MNAKQANQIKLTEIMNSLGYSIQHKHKGGNELAYLSPFRNESKGSFYINSVKNVFFDQGSGAGGTVVDFALEYLSSKGMKSNVSEALYWLKNLGCHDNLTEDFFVSDSKPKVEQRDLEFIKATEIKNPIIFKYLKSRMIPEHLVSKYLKEIHYRNKKTGKIYFGFGIENLSGGYEIRSAGDNPTFKSSIINKDISFIKGREEGGSINIFEGTVDYLSLMVLQNIDHLKHDTIVTHSLSSLNRVIDFLNKNKYTKLNLWVDNDKAGQYFKSKIKGSLEEQIVDFSNLYNQYNDLNLYLINNCYIDYRNFNLFLN